MAVEVLGCGTDGKPAADSVGNMCIDRSGCNECGEGWSLLLQEGGMAEGFLRPPKRSSEYCPFIGIVKRITLYIALL